MSRETIVCIPKCAVSASNPHLSERCLLAEGKRRQGRSLMRRFECHSLDYTDRYSETQVKESSDCFAPTTCQRLR